MDKESKFYTGFLFSTDNYLTGAGTIINLGGNYFEYNVTESGEADCVAIRNDFEMVGQDIRTAKREFEENLK